MSNNNKGVGWKFVGREKSLSENIARLKVEIAAVRQRKLPLG